MTRIAVVTAEKARALDERTIAALPDSYALMLRAATAAAEALQEQAWRSAAVYVGSGNNGGDGWLIAGLLRARGWHVTVFASGEPRTDDARRARAAAEQGGPFAPPSGGEAIVLDALLGTGATGAPRGEVATALAALRATHGSHQPLIAIDLPTGLDATTGEDFGALAAERTLTFGSVKRAHLLRRDLVGVLQVLDIGLVDGDDAMQIVDAPFVRERLPVMRPDAYKRTRGRVAIVGGDVGMAGAAILAARGAHAAGAGMVRADVAQASAVALQVAVPFATVRTWSTPREWSHLDTTWPDAMVIGPGLDGAAPALRRQIIALLHAYRGPVVLDAGALTAFEPQHTADAEDIEDGGDGAQAHLEALRHALRGRQALLTPHVGEFAALWGARDIDRFTHPQQLAERLGATVLLKGVPTVIVAPGMAPLVSATGNPALGMGGTGDLLAGIAGTLLAQGMSALHAGAIAAWIHGTAAEHAVDTHGAWRGVTMDLLLHAVSNVWPRLFSPASHQSHPLPTVLVLPAVPCR
ncbi:MAG: NAD(P)H-hydrate dehydratase [Gemmatimonadota bacterium]